jgi:hypothetical protein
MIALIIDAKRYSISVFGRQGVGLPIPAPGAIVVPCESAPRFRACLHDQDATIEGMAVDSSTGQPLAGVHVHDFTLGATGLPAS